MDNRKPFWAILYDEFRQDNYSYTPQFLGSSTFKLYSDCFKKFEGKSGTYIIETKNNVFSYYIKQKDHPELDSYCAVVYPPYYYDKIHFSDKEDLYIYSSDNTTIKRDKINSIDFPNWVVYILLAIILLIPSVLMCIFYKNLYINGYNITNELVILYLFLVLVLFDSRHRKSQKLKKKRELFFSGYEECKKIQYAISEYKLNKEKENYE